MRTSARSTPRTGARPAPEAILDGVDLLRLDATRRLDPRRRTELGQFMTPAPIARLMASMFEAGGGSQRLLEAGAGIGSLTAAWVAEMCARGQAPREISVIAYELDGALIEDLRRTLEACERHCRHFGIAFSAEIRQEDFVAAGSAALRGGLFAGVREVFDAAILNPPYHKLASSSTARRLLAGVGVEVTNLYAAFLALAVGLLRPGGELVAITPRSFCNGPYFRSFRNWLLDRLVVRRIHGFESRDRAFEDDDVLQENVILHAARAPAAQRPVVISSTHGPDDVWPAWREVAPSRIVKPGDPERFIHVPADALSEGVDERMALFRATLADIGLEASTGRVVDFRVAPFLRGGPEAGSVPLIYPGHLVDGYVQWPKRGSKKPNALALAPETRDLVLPQGHYTIVKRFSSKEERRRIVAGLYDPSRVQTSAVAFENHVNYFHAHGQPLRRGVARGLACFLNSTLVDAYFRDWSGHTQVNASDLRRLRYPTLDQLEAFGAAIPETFASQDELDRRVEEDLLGMARAKKSPNPVTAKRRIQEALSVLKDLGFPRAQQNERSALTLLALLDLRPTTPWREAANPLCGITGMMGFFAEHYGKTYAPNTRETVRRSTVHQFVQSGMALANPDQPERPTNSPKAVYQVEAQTLALLRTFGGVEWADSLRAWLASVETLKQRYARERDIRRGARSEFGRRG